MFTGIILQMGKLESLEKKDPLTLTLTTSPLERVKIGDSVAVNGACLTVTAIDTHRTRYRFNLSQETLKLSHFSDLARGSAVNIELPLTLQDFLGGHLVSGHLDGLVRVKAIRKKRDGSQF
ncbi:MAG: riboflavin synthase, partial [bacterium]|nr:riboflavin synthase [bacterium]